MSRPRRSRALSAEERRLWAQVARGVIPLSGRAFPTAPEPEPEPVRGTTAPPAAAAPAPAAAPLRPAPGLAPVERKTLRALRRGARGADAVIDLHGMRQAEAHGALIGFLRRSQTAGATIVLVITGKGGPGAEGAVYEERGVLRRAVPHWLRLPDLRPLVLGFEEASPRHGGSGALYVRLRGRRGGQDG